MHTAIRYLLVGSAFVLLSACNGSSGEPGAVHDLTAASRAASIVVDLQRAELTIEPGPGPMQARYSFLPDTGDVPAGARLQIVENKDAVRIHDQGEAGARITGAGIIARVTLRIPADRSVTVGLQRGTLRTSASFRELTVRINDGTAAIAGTVHAGRIDIGRGSLELHPEAPPAGSLRATVQRGNIDASLPQSYRGSLNLTAKKRGIDLERDPRFTLTEDPTRTTIAGFSGRRMTRGEIREYMESGKPVAGFWAVAPAGTVKFRLQKP